MTQVRQINAITGEETTREYTAAELATIAAYAPTPTAPQPTKEALLAQIAILAAKVEALQ